MIPILDSLQATTPEKGTSINISRNAPNSNSEGGSGRAFGDILGSHGASLVADADEVPGQNPNIEGGNVLLSNGQALPPTPAPELVPAVPVFDFSPHVESSLALADTPLNVANESPNLLVPPAEQGSVALEPVVLTPGESVNAELMAVEQGTTEVPVTTTVILPPLPGANDASHEPRSEPVIVPAEAAFLASVAEANKEGAMTGPAAQALETSGNVSRSAEITLPMSPGLGDLAKKVVERSGLSQGSVFEPLTVASTDLRPVQPVHTISAEIKQGADMNLLPVMANTTKPGASVERAEAPGSQSISALDLSQYRLLPGAQPSALTTGLNYSAGQALSAGSSFTSSVGDVGWGQEFVGRMNVMAKDGVHEMKLQLKPAEMGLLEIKLTTEGDQTKVIFNVHNAAARDAIDLAMPRLRDMLEQSGLQLVHSEVNDNSSQRDQGNESDQLAALSGDAGVENESTDGSQLEAAFKVTNSLIDYYI